MKRWLLNELMSSEVCFPSWEGTDDIAFSGVIRSGLMMIKLNHTNTPLEKSLDEILHFPSLEENFFTSASP